MDGLNSGHDTTAHKTEQLMEINERLTKDEILSHTAEMFDGTVSKQENTRRVLLALTVGLLLGWMV